MVAPRLRLIRPCTKYHAEFLALAAEFHAAGEPDWPHGAWSGDRVALDDFEAYLRRCDETARGVNLPADHVPATTYWLLAPAGAQKDGLFDRVILGGRVIDGTGASVHAADTAIQGGRIADLVIFRPEKFVDKATPDSPAQYSEGSGGCW